MSLVPPLPSPLLVCFTCQDKQLWLGLPEITICSDRQLLCDGLCIRRPQ